MTKRPLARFLGSLAAVMLTAAGIGLPVGDAVAQAPAVREFNVPPQSLESALRQVAKENGLQLLYDPKDVRGLNTSGVRGSMSARQAVEKLLEGTGVAVSFGENGTVVLKPNEKGGQVANPTQLAQAHLQDAGASEETKKQEKIEVTGSRLKKLESEGAQPVTTVTREAIERSGASNLQELLTTVPQASTNRIGSTALVEGGATTINLRGLPNGSTLVLINGRRMGTSGHVAFLDSFDLNTIPLAAIERIEILSSGASAIYGADALAGVMNVILRKDIRGVIAEASYGGAADGAFNESRLAAILGGSFGRFSGTFIASSTRRDPLAGTDRPITQQGDYRSFGGSDFRTDFTNPGNVFAVSGNLPGLSSSFAAVPRGSTGVGLTPSSFAATAGTENLASFFEGGWILPDSKRDSFVGTAEVDLRTATVFAEAMHSENRENGRSSGGFFAFLDVPATNPFNPFRVPVNVAYSFPDVPTYADFRVELTRLLLGAKGTFGRSWDWEATAMRTREKSSLRQPLDIDPTGLAALLGSSNPQVALNPFRDGSGIDPSVIRALIIEQLSEYESRGRQFDAFVRGTAFELPAGGVDVVVGGLQRKEELIRAGIFGQVGTFTAEREVKSLFGEARVPLFGKSVAGDLAVSLATRRDDYSDFGVHNSNQFGLTWAATPWLLFRASHADSFKAPALLALYRQLRRFRLTVTDPLRNNERYIVNDAGQVGNPNLRPEEGVSRSVGVVFDIGNRTALFSIDWWQLDLSERILNMQVQPSIENEQLFPQFITRGAPTAADTAAGLPGRINRIYLSVANGGKGELEGIDLKFDYRARLFGGELRPSLSATYVRKFRAAGFSGGPLLERVGIAQNDGYAPKWKASAGVSWLLGPIDAGVGVRYTTSYTDYAPARAHEVSSATLTDLTLGYAFEATRGSLLDGTKFRLTVRNVFDKEPPLANTSMGFDPFQGDIIGRHWLLTVQKHFR